MSVAALFDQLWQQYTSVNPAVVKIHALFKDREEEVINDHIALRTFQHPKVNLDKLAQRFEQLGYQRQGQYQFIEKKLNAIHLQHEQDTSLPLVFISELKLSECSESLQRIVETEIIDKIPTDLPDSNNFCHSGRSWNNIKYETYELLRKESEYAAWMYVYGYMANHFTVKINALKSFESLETVNDYLETSGFELNTVGGKIKGTPEVFLEQSSTVAEKHPVHFSDGTYSIPSCFYEFARRYPQADGKEFRGFIEGNADKIFESTHMK